MEKEINAILIHQDDNVITTKKRLSAGSDAVYQFNGESHVVQVKEEIPQFHKIALTDIAASELVIKYGQLIGEAITAISRGSHVHVHNIKSPQKKA